MDSFHREISWFSLGITILLGVLQVWVVKLPEWLFFPSLAIAIGFMVYGVWPFIKQCTPQWIKNLRFQWPLYLKNTAISQDLDQGISAAWLPCIQITIRFDENFFETILEKDDTGIVRGSRKTYWIELYASGQNFLGVEVLVVRMDVVSQTDYQRGQLISLPENTRLANRADGKYVMNISVNSKACVPVVSFSDAAMDSFRLETEPYRTDTGKCGNRNFPAFHENVYKLWLAVFSEGRFMKIIEGTVGKENGRPKVAFYG